MRSVAQILFSVFLRRTPTLLSDVSANGANVSCTANCKDVYKRQEGDLRFIWKTIVRDNPKRTFRVFFSQFYVLIFTNFEPK